MVQSRFCGVQDGNEIPALIPCPLHSYTCVCDLGKPQGSPVWSRNAYGFAPDLEISSCSPNGHVASPSHSSVLVISTRLQLQEGSFPLLSSTPFP